MHHRARVGLRVVVGGERDSALRVASDAVFVHEARHLHRELLRRCAHAVRHLAGHVAGDRGGPGGLAEAAILALCERAEDDDALGQPGSDRRRAVRDRGGAAATSAARLHQRAAQPVRAARRSEARRIAAVVAVRREAVDLARVEAGIGAGGEDRLERELELGVGRLAVLVVGRLADADDGDLAMQAAC